MNDKTKKVIKYSVNSLFGVMILIILMFSVFAFSSKKNGGIPKVFGKSYVTVLSDSMKDEFKKGDLIVIKRFDKTTLANTTFKKGDVITFEAKTDDGKLTFVTHRIIEVDEIDEYYITQGDVQFNNPETSGKDGHIEQVAFMNVVGLYQNKKIKNIGNFFLFLQTQLGFFLFIVLPLILFLVFQSIDFSKALREYKEEKAVKEKGLQEEPNQ